MATSTTVSVSPQELADLREGVASAMLSSERFLEALMQEAPLGAPVRQPSDYRTDVERF